MLSIKIDSADLEYLIGSHLNKSICDILEDNAVKEFDKIKLVIERPIAEMILDFLGDELMQAGISENQEPNDFGIMIESIIDKFSKEVYDSHEQ